MSKDYSWTHRSSSGDNIFSWYYIYLRSLTFKKNGLILKNGIIKQMENNVSKIAQRVGYDCKLQFKNLMTTKLIDEKIELWRLGKFDVEKDMI